MTQQAAENVLDLIGVIDPALKRAKIDFSPTYDNKRVEAALHKYHSPVSQ